MANPTLSPSTGGTEAAPHFAVTDQTAGSVTVQDAAAKGAASGYASLDAGTKVPTAQLGGAGADATKFLRGDQSWQVPATGGGIGAKLFDSTLAAAAAAIDTGAGGIASGHDALEVWFIGRTTEAVVNSTARLTFNNDTGANYDREFMQGADVTASAGNTFAANFIQFGVAGANTTASVVGTHIIWIPAYDQTTFHKQAMLNNARAGQSGGESVVALVGGHWRSTAAITRLAITAGSGNFVAGSRMIVYGRT